MRTRACCLAVRRMAAKLCSVTVLQCQAVETGEEALDEGSKGINEQASYAASKLRQLCEKLEYKRQALGSIQNAPKPDKKVSLVSKRLLFECPLSGLRGLLIYDLPEVGLALAAKSPVLI